MTLITTSGSEGTTGRCDARCYNAKGPDCDCCCGGLNHGKGLQKAIENTQKQAETIIENWNNEHPGEKVSFESIQGELF
ncbi:hypothetical protein ES703_36322 [subsurface metagenome]